MRKRIKDFWSALRHFLSVRSLLDLLGWKDRVTFVLAFFPVWLWSRLNGLAGPVQLVLGLVGAVCVAVLLVLWRIWRLIARAPSVEGTATKDLAHAVEGPEVVMDYEYAEDSRDHHDPNRPLALKNISPTHRAYNVRVLPLTIPEGRVTFEPDLVPYIESLGTTNVFALVAEGSPLFRRRLPEFLYRTYRDSSAEELFATRGFALQVQYEDMHGTVFETECELRFRPWKKEITVGRTTRRTLESRRAR